MQTIYKLKAKEISMDLLKSLKTMFAGQEVEITVKSIEPERTPTKNQEQLLQMIQKNKNNAPVIDPSVHF